MAKPHKFAWNGIDVETSLSVEQLANMAQRAAQECTGDLMYGKHRIASVKSTDRQIEFRVNDFLITFKKFMVFYLDFEQRGDRVWMSSRIDWYVTSQPTVGGFIPVSAKIMVGHNTYLQFVRHLAAQVRSADPQARVTIREGVAGRTPVTEPSAPASGQPAQTRSFAAKEPPAPFVAPAPAPRPSSPPPPLGRVVPPPPPPPPPPPQRPAPVPYQAAPTVIAPAPGVRPQPVQPAVRGPLAPQPKPAVSARPPATGGAGAMVTSVPGMPSRAPSVEPSRPEPAPSKYASLAEQLFAEDEELFETHLAQSGSAALPWLLSHAGGAVPLEDAVVLGRNPAAPPSAPKAGRVAVNDPNKSVSKTHALIELRDGLPWVTDLNSTNGTTLTNEVGEALVCVPGVAVPVGDEWQVGLGEYSLILSRRG